MTNNVGKKWINRFQKDFFLKKGIGVSFTQTKQKCDQNDQERNKERIDYKKLISLCRVQ